MCGLALAANKKRKRVGHRVYDLYKKQKHRGQAGYGFISIQDGVMQELVRGKSELSIKSELLSEQSELILFHHRQPTSTPNTIGTTHPIFVSNDELEHDYYVMHNGCVSNDDELKKKHEELGYIYTTEYVEMKFAKNNAGEMEILETGDTKFNDSEALAIEAARLIEGKQNKMENRGAAAFFVVQLEKGSKNVAAVYYAQNFGRQLGFQKKKGWTLIASENGKEVTQLKLYRMDPKTFEITESELDMDEAHKAVKSPYHYGGEQGSFRNLHSALAPANKYGLVNAYYTRQERDESGAPPTEFFASRVPVYLNAPLEYMYVPLAFAGVNESSRPLFSEAYEWVEEEQTINYGRLEELALEYAKKQQEWDFVNDKLQSEPSYQNLWKGRATNIEQSMNRIEEQMYSLGAKEDEVEGAVAFAQDMMTEDHKV